MDEFRWPCKPSSGSAGGITNSRVSSQLLTTFHASSGRTKIFPFTYTIITTQMTTKIQNYKTNCFCNLASFYCVIYRPVTRRPFPNGGFSKWIFIRFIGHTPHFSSFVCHLLWLLNSSKIKVWLFRNHFVKHYMPFSTSFSYMSCTRQEKLLSLS